MIAIFIKLHNSKKNSLPATITQQLQRCATALGGLLDAARNARRTLVAAVEDADAVISIMEVLQQAHSSKADAIMADLQRSVQGYAVPYHNSAVLLEASMRRCGIAPLQQTSKPEVRSKSP
jgi:hypothetical protein